MILRSYVNITTIIQTPIGADNLEHIPGRHGRKRFSGRSSAAFTYRRFGRQGGVPLVLLNRFRGTIDWWDPEFLDYLAAHHDVIVFDNVGIGYSSGEPRDSIEGFAEGAIEFIEALGLSTVDLLGWSLGGIVAQEIARCRPELVRKLVVAGRAIRALKRRDT